jgi:predicted permease
MSWFSGMFGGKAHERLLDSELRFHLEQQTRDNIAAGMSPDDARREAAISLGGLEQIKEECRDERSGAWLGQISQDLRFGLRMLRKNPTFTLIAVLSLALGLGAATSAFWMLDAVFMGSLPVPDPQDLRVICWSGSETHFSWQFTIMGEGDLVVPGRKAGNSFSKEAFFSLRKQCAALADIFAYSPMSGIARAKGKPVHIAGQMVSGNYFSALGVRPLLGNFLGVEDESAAAAPRVVISYRWWEREFGRDPGAIGQQVTINGRSYAVAGVLPSEFTGTNPGWRADLFVSLSPNLAFNPDMPPEMGNMPGGYWLAVMGRLKPGVTPSQFQANLDVALNSAVGKFITSPLGVVVDGRDGTISGRVDLQRKLRLLMAVVGVALLAACVNIAGLLVARGAARQRELALRGALGAGRWRLVRQLLTESTLLSLVGGVLGVLFALWGKIVVARLVADSPEGVQYAAAPDLKVLGFALAATMLSVLLAGLFPALKAARIDLRSGMRDNPAIGARRLRAGQVLVAAQIALSLLFVTGAGLYARTLINLYRIDPGYAMDHLLLLKLDPAASGVQVPRAVEYCEDLQRSLAGIPGVQSAALTAFVPAGDMGWATFTIPGRPPDGDTTAAPMQAVGEGFFTTMGIPILEGRELRAGDRDGTTKVIVINEAFARKFIPDRPPVGGVVKCEGADWQVVGVCRDTRSQGIKQAAEPTIYFPFRQKGAAASSFAISFALRTAVSPMSVAAAAERAATAINPDVPATDLYTQEQLRDQNIATERACVGYYGSLAAFVLLLSCMGLYGLMAFDVARRTGEFGVRMALGAAPRQIVLPILRTALWLAFWGFVAGLPLTLVLTRFIRANLYGVTASDPVTFVGASLLLAGVMLVAAWIPARRATRVDPMVALRNE